MHKMQHWLQGASDIRRWHQLLSLSMGTLLIVIAISGVILSIVPIRTAFSNTVQPIQSLNLQTLLQRLDKNFSQIEKITVTPSNEVIIETRNNNKLEQMYVDVKTGAAIKPVESSEFFLKVKTFHRSLWLGDIGRIIVGISAFTLTIISITGCILLVKRQGGWRGLLLPAQGKGLSRWHSFIGQIFLGPLLLLAITGTYLVFVTFELISDGRESVRYPESREELTAVTASSLDSFASISLSSVKSLVYPIPEDWFDVYTLKTNNGYQFFDQFTGETLAAQNYKTQLKLNHWILLLHSGEGASLWALALGLTATTVPFFTITGVLVWWRRPTSKVGKSAKATHAEAVILVGSETKTTWQFAAGLNAALMENGVSVHLGDLNSFQPYPKAQWLFVLTATYGNGQAPANAQAFMNRLSKQSTQPNWKYAVVGFGDETYANFCRYAHNVSNALKEFAAPLTPLHTVNRQDHSEFKQWAGTLGEHLELPIKLPELTAEPESDFVKLKLIEKIHYEEGQVARLSFNCKHRFQPGDLLAVTKNFHSRARLYSVASHQRDGCLTICVKKVERGECSNYLHSLAIGETANARLQPNPHFQQPKGAKRIIFIATGTGVAPFAGMIANNKNKVNMTLFFGCRHAKHENLYADESLTWLSENRLTKRFVAYSRDTESHYVQDLIVLNSDYVLHEIELGAVIMVCGSHRMAQSVGRTLDKLFTDNNVQNSVNALQSQQRFIVESYGG
jgi:sulfite reductase (NADPH) flavoprotein alpha-component